MPGRRWTDREKETLRERYHSVPVPQIAAELGRNARQVYNQAHAMGLHEPRRLVTAAGRETIRRMNADGATDPEIAAATGFSRKSVGDHRREMGLPANIYGERHRAKIRESTRRQLDRAGLSSAGEIRREAYRAFARESGWPDDLRPRAVQILNLLASVGVPLTRRQIADGVGMPWKGTRNSLASSDPEGSYLAHLCARGLAQRLRKAHRVTGQGRGRTCDSYCLGVGALQILAQRAGA